MIRAEELRSHGARCNRLADSCLDRTVAEKLRLLAKTYCELADRRYQELERSDAPAETPEQPTGS
jgi:hypothetical protein